MIFNNNKIYAKVWKVTPADNKKYIDLQITTSEKNQDEKYINSTWFPRVFGKALNSLKNVKKEDRIVITKSKFSNERYEDSEGNTRSRFRFLILEASIEDKEDNKNKSPANRSSAKQTAEAEDEDDPW